MQRLHAYWLWWNTWIGIELFTLKRFRVHCDLCNYSKGGILACWSLSKPTNSTPRREEIWESPPHMLNRPYCCTDCQLRMVGVQRLIKHGAEMNAGGGRWKLAFHATAAWSQFETATKVMKLLLDNGAWVDQRGSDNWEKCCKLPGEGEIEAVQFLLDRDAGVNA